MSFVSIREVTPHAGRESVVKDRMKEISSIMERHGSKSGLYSVVAGDGAGRFDLQNWYSTLTAAVNSFQAYGADPAYQAIIENRSSDPAGEIEGPWIGRMIYGAPKGIKPVVMHRDYYATRSAIPGILKLAPTVEELMATVDVEVGIGVPLVKGDHEMVRLVYRFNSMDHWGETADRMITDEQFLSLVDAGHKLGTLKNSRILVAI
ncbi:MAG: hypothetical protein HOI86_04975 [Tateyamaria sp.]|jgi:hypothetical protein|nr:hypothetical protein [Tateyamaria sp.]MBT6267020.1 hypothetical protein [Tateyamaria sp.]MBT7446329.1 hypothetical protein [Tateyamaria sp.]MBT7800044.1 hypothetical protein [Tateyamaria sp.]MCH9748102.1 hypothetical protein [Alphaproteobacteria bacterium]